MAKQKSKDPGNTDWVVGIGSSAGGLEALTQLLAEIPEDFPGSVIIAQHLAPHSKSLLVDLLGRRAPLPVMEAKDGCEIRSGYIYVVPPNHDVDVEEATIHLPIAGEETRPKPSVNQFFSSLAREYGPASVGVILSGTGTDGAEGLRAIHASGGTTLAQDPASAKYDGMPKSAIATGVVDFVCSPEEMGRDLAKLLKERSQRPKKERLSDQQLDEILDILKRKQGRDFSQYKTSTIQRRIDRRVQSLGLRNLKEYVAKIESTPEELRVLSQELLVSVTSFFRDPEVFVKIESILSQYCKDLSEGDEFRAWVAGCATGEEAYSLAILLSEIQARLKRTFRVKLFATDLDQDAILEARNGVYSLKAIEKVPSDLLDRYFLRRNEDSFEVVKSIRDQVVFANQDLVQNAPFVKLDLISCRNVLIYFENKLQAQVLESFHYALKPAGILLLGKSESLGEHKEIFEVADIKTKIYRKLNVAPRLRSAAKQAPIFYPMRMVETKTLREQAQILSDTASSSLFEAFGIGGLVIDKSEAIVHVLGDVSRFLKIPAGFADFRLSNLLPQALGIELGLLVRKAGTQAGQYRSRTHRKKLGKTEVEYKMVVQSFSEEVPQPLRSHFLVFFESTEAKKPRKSSVNWDADLPARYMELEQELHLTREHLQTVIEELGVSNEELQAVNEELSSTNEELQASNEELETTNEELQSSNEELTTVNEELSHKTAELRVLNASLENVQTAIGFPMLVLDEKLRVSRFNKEAAKIFNISTSDIGRELFKVPTHCKLPTLEQDLRTTAENGSEVCFQCETSSEVFQARSLPIYDDLRKFTGVLVFFFNNTEVLRAQKRIQMSERRLQAIIDTSAGLVSLKDTVGKYLVVNSAFAQFFGRKKEDILGKTDQEIFGSEMAVQLRKQDLEALVHSAEPLQGEETFKNQSGDDRTFLVNRFALTDIEADVPYAVATVATDITPQLKEQADRELVYRHLFKNTADFVAIYKCVGDEFILESLNEAAEAALGVSATQLVGKNLRDFVKKDREEAVVQSYREAVTSGAIQVIEETHGVPSDLRHYLTTIIPITSADGKIVKIAGVSRDISRSKVVEQDLRVAKEQADLANRAKTEFLASMSHELRTPLNVVIGMSELLRATGLNKEQKEFVSSIHRSGKVLLSLIEDVLDISKIEAGKVKLNYSPFSINKLMQEITGMFKPQAAQKDLKFLADIEEGADHCVVGDIDRLRQVLVNLIGNAIKFTIEGEIRVRVNMQSQKTSSGENIFRFEVADSGIGIPKQYHNKIFTQFTQLDSGDSRQYGGSGLGLAICKRLVHLMGGEIDFKSDEGKGASFFFSVPLTVTDQKTIANLRKATRAKLRKPPTASRKLSMLVVDDNQDGQAVTKLLLERAGHECVAVSSGKEALRLVQKKHFDLVFMDVQMPGMDGLQATQEIRKISKDVPIIALTANALSGDAERCLEAGMDDYVAKPVNWPALDQVIGRWAADYASQDN